MFHTVWQVLLGVVIAVFAWPIVRRFEKHWDERNWSELCFDVALLVILAGGEVLIISKLIFVR